jgi:hypothetical protein
MPELKQIDVRSFAASSALAGGEQLADTAVLHRF